MAALKKIMHVYNFGKSKIMHQPSSQMVLNIFKLFRIINATSYQAYTINYTPEWMKSQRVWTKFDPKFIFP